MILIARAKNLVKGIVIARAEDHLVNGGSHAHRDDGGDDASIDEGSLLSDDVLCAR